jgi:gluconate kinase
LRSQFAALEEPSADENAITVAVDAAPEEIASEVLRSLAGEAR